MSRLSYYTDFVAIPTLFAVLLLTRDCSILGVALGILIWTIAEYVIHRFLFHRIPVFKVGHDQHHENPHARTGVTSWHSLAIFAGLALATPAGVLAGIAIGYFGYIGAHHVVHHWTVGPDHWLYPLKMRHRMHHKGVEANFGIITTVWDRVFGTFQPWSSRSAGNAR